MLHDTVVQRWGTDIVSGAMPPGYRIGTDEAAAHLGVSRTVAREAMRVLESMGLITIRQRLGITVSPRDRWNLLDPNISRWQLAGPDAVQHLLALDQLRAVNEPLAARLAAQHATSGQIDALGAAVVGMATAARSGDQPAFAASDAAFHRVLLIASTNPLLTGLAAVVADALTSPVAGAAASQCSAPATITLHGTAAAAIHAGDGQTAGDALFAILTETRGSHDSKY